MIIVNFGHPITKEQQDQIVARSGLFIDQLLIDKIIDVPSQIDHQKPLAEQIINMVDKVGLTRQQWKSETIFINLPSLNFSAAVVLAELHGRMGYFPPVLRLRPVAGATPPRYEVAEILNLYEIQENAQFRKFLQS